MTKITYDPEEKEREELLPYNTDLDRITDADEQDRRVDEIGARNGQTYEDPIKPQE